MTRRTGDWKMRGFDADCRIDKCRFVVESVVYLGYEISRAGVKPLRSKVETITAPRHHTLRTAAK